MADTTRRRDVTGERFVRIVDKNGNKVVGTRQAAVASVVGTADATYSANEVTLINANTTAINAILAALRAHGLIAT
jgi:hypothetical protein